MINITPRITRLFGMLAVATLAACGSPTDSTDVGRAQSDETVGEITATPGNPYAGSGQAAPVTITPVTHGSVYLEYAGTKILVDPYDGAERYTGFGAPDVVLITHTHPDHMDTKTLGGLDLQQATLVAPQAVMGAIGGVKFADKVTMANGDTTDYKGISIEAVPAYNYPPSRFHPKGEFNGYVLNMGTERIYFSGDTGPAPELEDLGIINTAFICMNQPYTMTVEQAAALTAKMAPQLVRPYHYRNQDGSFSDLEKFRKLVKAQAPGINVLIEDWYASK